MWRYFSTLPVQDPKNVVSLHEGSTPLQKASSFPAGNVFLKLEVRNPTGSHKDRMLSAGISKAREFGMKTSLLYSDGSTGLSSAAYAAKAGMHNIVVTPAGASPTRLLPLTVFGSTLLEFQGGSAEAITWVHKACRDYGLYETSTYRRANPYEGEGVKTIAYEIFEQLGRSPDWVVVPLGGGGTLAGIWRGFQELAKWDFAKTLPRMLGVVPKGYDLLPNAIRNGLTSEDELRAAMSPHEPPTIQVKIAMPWPPDGAEAIAAVQQSRGRIIEVSDDQAMLGLHQLASKEGVYTEPSTSVAMVAVDQLRDMEPDLDELLIVVVVCGSGFRETEAISTRASLDLIRINAESGAKQLEKVLAQRDRNGNCVSG